MVITNDENDKWIAGVTILLTHDEMAQLAGATKQLVNAPSGDHRHISSADYQREVTICVYESGKLDMFTKEVQAMIAEAETRDQAWRPKESE